MCIYASKVICSSICHIVMFHTNYLSVYFHDFNFVTDAWTRGTIKIWTSPNMIYDKASPPTPTLQTWNMRKPKV